MLVSKDHISVLLIFFAGLSGCADNERQSDKLAATTSQTNQLSRIEKIELQIDQQVQLSHPDIDLGQYVRYFTHSSDGKLVLGQYIIGDAVNGELSSEPGKSVWTADTNWPRILDGGCAVINIKHDLVRGGVTEVWCNGVA